MGVADPLGAHHDDEVRCGVDAHPLGEWLQHRTGVGVVERGQNLGGCGHGVGDAEHLLRGGHALGVPQLQVARHRQPDQHDARDRGLQREQLPGKAPPACAPHQPLLASYEMNRRATITSPRRMLAAMVAGIPAPVQSA
jgi:hypothetical protein